MSPRLARLGLLLAIFAASADRARAEEPAVVAVAPPDPAKDLEPVLSQLLQGKSLAKVSMGFHVVDLTTGEEVFAKNADRALTPASTMKALTAATALKRLGPSYRWTTDVYSDAPIDAAGVINGNLYIEGHGDPTMVVEKLWKLILDLHLDGVRRVAGDVIFDEDFFPPSYAMAGWDKIEDVRRGPTYFATMSALALNFNTTALVVGPGPEAGKPASVRLETPAHDYIEVVNEVKTGTTNARATLDLDREVLANGTMKFTVRGIAPLGSPPERIYRTVQDPTTNFIGAFRDLMGERGIEVGGRYRRGDTPRSATRMFSLRSDPLASVLMEMNKNSNNFIAEQVLRTVGAEEKGAGTTDAGLEVVREYLTELGVDPAEYVLTNGSGLSREAKVSPSVLTAMLVDMARDRLVGSEFAASLSIAGRDGTLWARLRDEAGRLRGKTGTIDGVHCLTGYVEDARGGQYAFALMANELGNVRTVKDLHDRFARELLSYGEQPAQ